MSNIPDTIDLAVYGTLRIGQYNDARLGGLSRTAKRVVRDFVIETGRMYNCRPGRPAYPVVDFRIPGRIVSDLFIGISTHTSTFHSVHSMERGAGYQLVELGKEVAASPSGNPVYVFHFGVGNYPPGPEVPNGDWLAWEEDCAFPYA